VNQILQEWSASCVDDALTQLNVVSLEGDRAYDYLLYAEDIPRRNDGRITNQILKRYEHLEAGGWWCSGIDILTGDDDLWGCFKPTQPRCSLKKGKIIKYEHPFKTVTSLFALRVPLHLWEQIAARNKLKVKPEDVKKDQPDLGFWEWFLDHPQIPLCVTEGAKKAGALLTAGYVAIALPGIYGGYRTPKDAQGQRVGKSRLIPQLATLTQQQRPVYITFDQDSKPKTIKAVNTAIRQTGYLLTQQGCEVKVITWDHHQGKGVDDLIAKAGQAEFDRGYEIALPLDTWKAQILNHLTYSPEVELNRRYINNVAIPVSAQLIGIKSAKGTGKTEFLQKIVTQAIEQQQKVLVIGHRVQLVEALCQRFGLPYIREVRDNPEKATLGYGLCIDSLHPDSQAKFNPQDWEDSLVIIDEVEQVLWHGLNSDTCREHRVSILKSFKTLLEKVLGEGGEVYIADADLTDTSLDYLLNLAGVPLQPFIIQNHWRPTEKPWQVHNYGDKNPQRLVNDLETHIAQGGKPFVCLSAQKLKSRWGTCTLESYLQQQFPKAKILRIDSESLNEPNHPAYQCIQHLDETLQNYDIVLASPSIETGVSIDLKGHFTSVWAIAQGVQGESSVRQAIGRIRDPIPRHLWIANYGFNRVGNGSTSIPGLINSGQRLTQLNIRLLQQSDLSALDDLDTNFQAESLLCWAKMAVRFNAGMKCYRESVLAGLKREGHQVQEVETIIQQPEPTVNPEKALAEMITQVRDQNYQAECEAVAASAEIDEETYQCLKKRLVKNPTERRLQRKYELKQRYGLNVTPELITKDDQGWYGKLRLHYFLTVGRQHLAERDATVVREMLSLGGGDLFLPDFNRSQFGVSVGILDTLGIPVLLNRTQGYISKEDKDLQQLAKIAIANRSLIKTSMGIGLAKNATPITVVRRLIERLGYGVKYIKCGGDRVKRIRYYQIVQPDDHRWQVFQHWLALAGQPVAMEHSMVAIPPSPASKDYIQLSLEV
jgi:hypothetical protein